MSQASRRHPLAAYAAIGAVLVASAASDVTFATHTPPPAEDILLESQPLVNFTYQYASALEIEFKERHHESFSSVNWSNTSTVYDAALNYTSWAGQRLQNLSAELNLTQPPITIFRNFTRLFAPNFNELECNGDPSTANPLLLDGKLTSLYEKINLANGSATYLTTEAQLLPLDVKKALVFSFECLLDIATQLNNAHVALNQTERDNLFNNETRAFDIAQRLQNANSSDEQWLTEYTGIVAQIDQRALANSTSLAIDLAITLKDFFSTTNVCPGLTNTEVDVLHFIKVGSCNADNHTDWKHFLLDPGGSDNHTGNAGGAKGDALLERSAHCNKNTLRCGIAISIDLGTESDSYVPTDIADSEVVVGSGRAALGLLLDEGGSETYSTSLWIGMAEVGGAAALLDLAGDDVYDATRGDPSDDRPAIGGAGNGGIGFMLDLAGDDLMVQDGADSMGWGGRLARGALFNHLGNDRYRLEFGRIMTFNKTGPGMGIGESGGIGLLLDDDGDDHYWCSAPVNYGCMGAAHTGGIGLLMDINGSDTRWINYTFVDTNPDTDEGNFSSGLGGAYTIGIGVLYDARGDDTYAVDARGGGYGGCLGIGMLLDMAGSDTYSTANGTSFGHGKNPPCQGIGPETRGTGVLKDAGQDTDSYSAPAPPSHCGSRTNNKLWRDGPGTGVNATGIGIDGLPDNTASCLP